MVPVALFKYMVPCGLHDLRSPRMTERRAAYIECTVTKMHEEGLTFLSSRSSLTAGLLGGEGRLRHCMYGFCE